jgi:opacity protein-like surface antigen
MNCRHTLVLCPVCPLPAVEDDDNLATQRSSEPRASQQSPRAAGNRGFFRLIRAWHAGRCRATSVFRPPRCPWPPTVSLSQSGWTVGVGGEYAFLNWLTGFVEYDYYRFNNNNSTALACTAVVCGITTTGVGVSTNINARALQMGA